MTRTELIDRCTMRMNVLERNEVEISIRLIIDLMSKTLANRDRIEIRGFGSFSIHTRKAGVSRNPKTGKPCQVPEKHIPHFKPGKELKERVNANL